MWLLEYANEKLSFVVEIKGSHGTATDPGYFHGELEGMRGWTGRVLEAGEVTVPFVPLQSTQFEKVQVPIKFLVPVPPHAKGDMAMPLSGNHKGEVLKVTKVEESLCQLLVPVSGIVVEIPLDQLVRLFDPKTGMYFASDFVIPSSILTKMSSSRLVVNGTHVKMEGTHHMRM
jgi:hypothetical protein